MVVVDCCTGGEEVEAGIFHPGAGEVGNVFACGSRTISVMVMTDVTGEFSASNWSNRLNQPYTLF